MKKIMSIQLKWKDESEKEFGFETRFDKNPIKDKEKVIDVFNLLAENIYRWLEDQNKNGK